MEPKVRFEPIETNDQLMVKHLLGDLDRSVNSDLVKLALKLSKASGCLRLDNSKSTEVMQMQVADRVLSICGLNERRAEVNKLITINQELKDKLEQLKDQTPKAKQQLERGDTYMKRADEQVNTYRSQMNEQHQLCKQLEKKLFEIGFNMSITNSALAKLDKDNDLLEAQIQEEEKMLKGLNLQEFTDQEVRQRIQQLRDELNSFDDLFDEQSEYIFPDL